MPLFGPPDVKRMKEKRDTAGLIKALRDRRREVRLEAAEALGEIGDGSAVDALIETLGDVREDVRRAAAHSLGELHDPRAVSPLIAAIRSKFVSGDRAAEALRELGEAAVEQLISVLSDDDHAVRYYAARTLGELGDARAVEPLIAATLQDRRWSVRREAATALGKLCDSRATSTLSAALKDGDTYTQMKAAWALGRLSDPRAQETLAAFEGENADIAAAVTLQLLPEPAKTMAVKLKNMFSAAAAEWWSSSGRETAICDYGGERLNHGEGYLRKAEVETAVDSYLALACERCTDRFLSRVKDWDKETLSQETASFLARKEARGDIGA